MNKALYKPVRKSFPKRKIITLGIDDFWAAGLIIMPNYGDQNNNSKYMLQVIDTI